MRILVTLLVVGLGLFACNTSKSTPSETDTTTSTSTTSNQDYIPGQVLVLLKPKANAEELAKAHTDIGMKAKGRASRSQNQWIFTFDSAKIKGKKLVQTLLASPMVESAELAPLKK